MKETRPVKISSLNRLPLLLTAVAGLLVAPGCKQENKAPAAGDTEAPAPAKKPVVRLVYVNWAEGVAMTHLVQAILEDRMGYEVKTTMADVAPVFASLANGDADAFLDGWLPVTHQSYMERFQGKVVTWAPTTRTPGLAWSSRRTWTSPASSSSTARRRT